MRIIIISIIFSFLFHSSLIGQISTTTIHKNNYSIHYQNPARKILIYAPKNILKSYYEEYGYPVYKILVISTRNREEANRIYEELQSTFPKHSTELSFREPFYKIIYGYFKLREDAELELKKLNRYFLNQRPLVIFHKEEPIDKVDSVFSIQKEFMRHNK